MGWSTVLLPWCSNPKSLARLCSPICYGMVLFLQRDLFVSSIQINIVPYFLLTARGLNIIQITQMSQLGKKKKKTELQINLLPHLPIGSSGTHITHTMDTRRRHQEVLLALPPGETSTEGGSELFRVRPQQTEVAIRQRARAVSPLLQ